MDYNIRNDRVMTMILFSLITQESWRNIFAPTTVGRQAESQLKEFSRVARNDKTSGEFSTTHKQTLQFRYASEPSNEHDAPEHHTGGGCIRGKHSAIQTHGSPVGG